MYKASFILYLLQKKDKKFRMSIISRRGSKVSRAIQNNFDAFCYIYVATVIKIAFRISFLMIQRREGAGAGHYPLAISHQRYSYSYTLQYSRFNVASKKLG